MRKQTRTLLSLVLALTLCLGAAVPALAADPPADPSEEFYVLMNIPYDEFYAAEGALDAVTSATRNGKARNVNVNGASYHRSEAAVTEEGIAGAMFPVRATMAALDALGAVRVTDDDTLSYEMTARGTTTIVTLNGADVLQERPDYAYYVLSETPAAYKPLTVEGGEASFGAAVGTPQTGTVTGEATVGAHHADIEIALTGAEVEAKDVSGVIVTAGDESYALHHVTNIWRGTEIGWNLSDIDLGGRTITGVRYFLKSGGIIDYSADIAIADAGYVLMNIPYNEFYAAELGDAGSVDAVSGATLKYANPSVAGGSYHTVDAAEDAEVTAEGVTFPVFVPDKAALDAGLQVTDETVKTIHQVSGREKTITETEASGRDALFCADSYSWYALAEKPARYKTMTAEGGAFSFSAVSGRATAVADVTGTASYYTHHGNYVEISLNGLTLSENVGGLVVTFDDGSVMGMSHVQNIWSKTQIGWASPEEVAGKTIKNVTFITADNVYACDVDIAVKLPVGEAAAAFEDADTITVTGLPDDIENPVATVQTQVGRGETATVIAENVAVTGGTITTTQAATEKVTDAGTEPQPYAITITSDNYADISLTASYALPEGEHFLSQIIGEYQPLFEGATFNAAYDHYWHDYAAAVVGASAADDTVAYMKSSIGAQGYGDNADAPNFFCGFTGGVATITFGGEEGKTVTYTMTDGSSATYTYAFVKEAAASGTYGEYPMSMDGYLYKAQEADAGEFQYLLMFPDTPDTTYHLEFRYGDTEENITKLLEGPYAYWVGSAIKTSALTEENEDTLQKVISLFVVENLAENTTEETAAQRAGLVGTWDCDFSAFPEYANAQMYIVLSANGEGKTYADFTGSGEMTLTAEYTFFAYDTDEADGKDAGTYISLNTAAETVTPGSYEIKEINGKKALVFTSNEGEITYLLREEQQQSGDADDSGDSGSGGGSSSAPSSGTTPAASDSVKFDDVADESAYYYEPVYWAARKGVTQGVDATHFGPASPCTRAQTLTFLWRAAGSPEPTGTENPFADVRSGDYYYKAVLWAVENGVTQGVDATHFAPDARVTRGDCVTFLFRAAKGAAEGTQSPFSDVQSGDYFYDAVLWAAEKGVTKGTDPTHFSPAPDCTRGEVVTFLYRLYA